MSGVQLILPPGDLLALLPTGVDRGLFQLRMTGLRDMNSSYAGLGLGVFIAAASLLLSVAVGKLVSSLLERTRREAPIVDFSLLVTETDEYYSHDDLMALLPANVDLIEEDRDSAGRTYQWVEALPALDFPDRVET